MITDVLSILARPCAARAVFPLARDTRVSSDLSGKFVIRFGQEVSLVVVAELRRLRAERGADARRADADGERVLRGGAADPRHVREQVLPEEVVGVAAARDELACLYKHTT